MPTFPPRKWLLAAVSAFIFASTYFSVTPTLRAVSASWNSSPTNGNWVAAVENNWNNTTGVFPGTLGTTTNPDLATFLSSTFTTININSGTLNVKSINFGTGAVGASNYTIGATPGNSLLLSSGGEIAILNFAAGATNGSSVTETIAASLVLEPASAATAGTYTFRNSSVSTTNSLVFSGNITGGTTSAGITVTLGGTNTGANGAVISGTVGNGTAAGGLSILKNTSATWVLSGATANTYSGKTTVTAGTLFLNKTAGVDAISSTGATGTNATNTDLQITGGTVQLNANNQIIDSAKVGLSGGTLKLNGVSEGTTAPTGAGVGALTLSSNSVIDLANTSVLHFADSSGQAWSGTLSIYNYSGIPFAGNGSEQLLFGSNGSGLTQAQLNSISFYSGAGAGFLGTGGFAPAMDGEVVPVPEPGSWIGAALALGAIGFTHRKRFRGWIA
jgi:autotransporter-associated beta strand protein